MINYKTINSANLIHNYNYCKSKFPNLCLMIKANAYGHGMSQIIRILEHYNGLYGVANAKEALFVKSLSLGAKVLIVGKIDTKLKQLIQKGVFLTVDCISDLQKIERECKKINAKAYVHIAINSGMNRIGVNRVTDFKHLLAFINKSEHIELCGVFTHMFDCDYKRNNYKRQIDIFYEYVKEVIGQKDILIHIGGSFVLNHKIPHFVNMVRVGYFLYGYGNKNLLPVLSIKSHIIKITYCNKGEYVGYGKTKLKKSKTIALVNIGYADGIPRAINKSGYAIVDEQKCRIVGNVCMDMLFLDVTNVCCKVGDVVEFPSAYELSKMANTSPYEILTNFSCTRAITTVI